MLTEREIEFIAHSVYWYTRWSDSNPEVGMGLTLQTAIKRVCTKMSYYPLDSEILKIKEWVKVLLKIDNNRNWG